MSRDEYDVAEPGPRQRDPADGPHAPGLPACPHCGGGPPVRVPALGHTVCKSCARVVT